jgi:EmrB/QacA subfamily drug resistance transporter
MGRTRVVSLLSFAALTYALAQTMIIAAFDELKGTFAASTSSVAWTLSAFLVISAVATPVLGRLGDMFGKRRMLVAALVLFCAGSIVAALAHSLAVIVIGRAVQGLGGGIFPLCFSIARDELPPDKRRSGIGMISAMVGLGGGGGLLLGGLLIDHVGWQSIFWLSAAEAALAAVLVRRFVGDSGVRNPGRVDVVGAVLLAVGLVLPLAAVTQAPAWGWSDPRIVALTVVGLALLAVWVRYERRRPAPLVNLTLLTSRPVLMTNAATFLAGFGMFGSFIAIPQIAQAPLADHGLGLDATGIGLLLLPGALVMLVCGPLSGWLGNRTASRIPLVLGGTLSAVGLIGLGLYHGSDAQLLAFSVPMYAGIGLSYAAMPNLIVDAVPLRQTGEATGVNALVRSVGSALGGQVCATLLASSALADGAPGGSGVTASFFISAAVAGLGAIVAVMIPSVPQGRDAAGPGAVTAGCPQPELQLN